MEGLEGQGASQSKQWSREREREKKKSQGGRRGSEIPPLNEILPLGAS
jgi:hypothetical protein